MIGPQTVNVKDKHTDKIQSMFDDAAKAIGAIIITAFSQRVRSKPAVQAKVRMVTTKLNQSTADFIDKNLPQYYISGTNNAIQGLRANDIKPTVTKITDMDKKAITANTDAAKAALQDASAGLARSASKIVSAGVKQQTRSIVANGRLNSDDVKNIVANVQKMLDDNGVNALVDKAGKTWDAGTYAKMAVKTEAVSIRNDGMFNRMLANGFDLVQISDNGSDHPACEAWESVIVSINGDTPGYPTIDDAIADGLFHPNCQHSANPVDPSDADGAYDSSAGNESDDDEEIDAENS